MTVLLLPNVTLSQATSGNYQLVFASERSGTQGQVFTANTDGSSVTPFEFGNRLYIAPACSADGVYLASVSDTVYLTRFDLGNSQRIDVGEIDPYSGLAVSNNGSKIAFSSRRDGNNELYVINQNGTGLTRLTNNIRNDILPNFSPDGTKIAFESKRDGYTSIYTINVDGTNLTKLAGTGQFDGTPAWSPDGTKIAFTSGRDGNFEIYTMNSNGSGIIRLTNTPSMDYWATWSPDGNQLAFVSDRNGNMDIFVMNVNGSNVQQVTNNSEFDDAPCWLITSNSQIPTPTPYPCPCSLFGSTTPANPSNIGNPPAVNLGVVFKPSVNGQVMGIRFYKLAGNGGTHKGYLWSAAGTQLGTVTFSGETATGWQTATFATPITVTANTVYVASYHAPQGRFAYDNNTFTSGRSVLPLYALATGETSPGNGTYIFGAAGLFPNATFTATNYWVDVVFSPT
ncbi:MAG: DUF4082 domain-containing protein [Chloroflexi bacterium]|nr:DUF4082 domain-containing protein [Chloroflexota bacterium]